MTTVTDIVSRAGASTVFMCDFSPPRTPGANWPDEVLSLNSDLICVPHLAPHPTRPDAITAAHLVRERTGAEVVFNFATRDASKSEVWERLGNARRLGLENIVVLQGDSDRGVGNVARENSFKPTELIRELQGLDEGFCVGAVADLAKGVEQEANLSRRKIDAGADFLLVQPTFDIDAAERFLAKADTSIPMFFGVQVLVSGGVAFAPVPESLRLEIENGQSGVDAAIEMISRFLRIGVNCFYLIAPIYRGGMRDYSAARNVMASFESGAGSAAPV